MAAGDDFIIGPSEVKGFIQTAGLTSSPAIADMVTDILKEEGLVLSEKADYDPNRKPIINIDREMLPLEEAEKLIALPEGIRLVCRCEQVVDSVKRRTRAMTGYYQGDFCRPRVVELMEREYEEPVSPKTDVEMRGDTRVTKEELLEYIGDIKRV